MAKIRLDQNETEKQGPKKPSVSKRLLGTLIPSSLLVVGLGLLFNVPIRNAVITNTSNKHQITQVDKKTLEENKVSDDATFDFDAVEPVSSANVVTPSLLKTDKKNPASFLTVAGIAIPDLNMNLPIFKGMDSNSLLYGAGTMKPDQEPGRGNYALASHHMFGYAGSENLLFSPLSRAKEGMTIYVTDKNKVYTYTITSIEEVDPTAVHVIDDEIDKTQITLVTCNDLEASKRIIVKGDFLEEKPFEPNTKEARAFEKQYTAVLF